MTPKIIIGYDGSGTAAQTVQVALNEAKLHRAEISVLTSVESPDDHPDEVARAQKNLEAVGKVVESSGTPCELHLLTRGMAPGEDIVEYATRLKALFIVIGVRRRSKVGKLLFGSTAQYVILNAPCPVICVP
jgi:nucleotide-binding universal stress UspA family protein